MNAAWWAKHYAERGDYYRAKARAWRIANPERCKEQQRKYRLDPAKMARKAVGES